MNFKLRKTAGPVLSLILFAAAVWLLQAELRTYHLRDILHALHAIPGGHLWAAVGLTLLSYTVMTGYDILAIHYIQAPLSYSKIALASFGGDASRFLRATVGAGIFGLFFAAARLMRPGPPRPAESGRQELETASAVVRNSKEASAHLALLGDKCLLYCQEGDAFIMYAVEGRSWIAMGEPIGPDLRWPELIWKFRELSDRYGGRTVFYEIGHERLHLYLDLGLSLLKLGEEARVPLKAFSLEGSARKGLRYTQRKLEKEGCRFEVIQSELVPAHLDELKNISDAWLTEKSTQEKGFSLGFFQADYIRRCPVAVVIRNERIEAFANLWTGAQLEELSLDLMRYLPQAPGGVMEYLFTCLMLWDKERGYRWFNLGMAPFSGLENRALAPLWNRLGAFIYRHGEHFYNFQGLRQYKEKFDPEWQPKYMASPGGLALPQIFTNLATLISGGMKQGEI